MEITLDQNTKIVLTSQFAFRQAKDADDPVDLARDTVLIIDARTHRPVAACRPIARTDRTAASPPESAREEARPSPGRLSDAQKERLARIWADNPGWGAQRVADEFARMYARTISIPTAESYRPGQQPGPGDPTPREIDDSTDAIRRGRLALKANGRPEKP